jgi:hypothetical protein
MNLIAVQCWRPGDDEAEPRLGIVIADDQAEAEELCENSYAREGFDRFKADTVIEGSFDGPARVLGYTGQKHAFSWNN